MTEVTILRLTENEEPLTVKGVNFITLSRYDQSILKNILKIDFLILELREDSYLHNKAYLMHQGFVLPFQIKRAKDLLMSELKTDFYEEALPNNDKGIKLLRTIEELASPRVLIDAKAPFVHTLKSSLEKKGVICHDLIRNKETNSLMIYP